ncbi:MAG: methylated-DNA--[protein]-cysteine S-methyltransferase [Armatimonadota bacterium]
MPDIVSYFKIKDTCFKSVVNKDRIKELSFINKLPLSAEKTVNNKLVKNLIKDLKLYFKGINVKFNYGLDLSYCSSFCREVFKKVQCIPYGKVISYKDLAVKINKANAARAVGTALGRNPVVILVPCHRIIKNDGSMGGFSSGVKFKKKLLKIEGVRL